MAPRLDDGKEPLSFLQFYCTKSDIVNIPARDLHNGTLTSYVPASLHSFRQIEPGFKENLFQLKHSV